MSPRQAARPCETNKGDLLLADLALQLGDVPPQCGALVRAVLPRALSLAQRFFLARPANPAQHFRSTLSVLVVPLVKSSPVRADVSCPRSKLLRRRSCASPVPASRPQGNTDTSSSCQFLFHEKLLAFSLSL